VIFRHPGFSFDPILDLLDDGDLLVRTVAGASLAAFSYNIASNQRLIARCDTGSRITLSHFKHLLRDGDELQRSAASFQVLRCSRFS